MEKYIRHILSEAHIISEILAAVIALIYYPKLKNTHWKWFVYYLVFIALESIIIKYFVPKNVINYIYDFMIVPIEFFFFFWLYAFQSLKKEKLFWTCIVIFIVSFLPHLFYTEKEKTINQLSYIVGCMLLFVLVLLEFKKQIIADDILLFKQNRMFYVNAGVVLCYIGSLPFFAFNLYLYEKEKEIFMNYYTYFLFSCNIMYLLFATSFIWGKSNT